MKCDLSMNEKLSELNDKIKELDRIAYQLEKLNKDMADCLSDWVDRLAEIGDKLDDDKKYDVEVLSQSLWDIVKEMQRKIPSQL